MDYDLYVGFSVQEEVGTRGAKTATALINPDFAIVTDVFPGQDYEINNNFWAISTRSNVTGNG